MIYLLIPICIFVSILLITISVFFIQKILFNFHNKLHKQYEKKIRYWTYATMRDVFRISKILYPNEENMTITQTFNNLQITEYFGTSQVTTKLISLILIQLKSDNKKLYNYFFKKEYNSKIMINNNVIEMIDYFYELYIFNLLIGFNMDIKERLEKETFSLASNVPKQFNGNIATWIESVEFNQMIMAKSDIIIVNALEKKINELYISD